MPRPNLKTITDLCPVDNRPHDFEQIMSKPGWIFCTKCATTVELTYPDDPIPPDPIPPDPGPDPRPVKVFTATGADDTTALQNWINSQPNDAIYDIHGTAAINQNGIRFTNKNNVKVTSTNGGGFKAISDTLYNASVFSAMVYAEAFNNSAF